MLVSDLDTLIHHRLAARERRVIEEPRTRRAAVLVPLYGTEEGPCVLVTRRTDTVEHHKGQISFPGGASDPTYPDPLTTALRETEEE
ncbi:MAG: NUDIX domain-containing protein, partial [Armatimonadetes bacterium]|nr:NUDIX domain-containing protein [Armatimonadota bacterium]